MTCLPSFHDTTSTNNLFTSLQITILTHMHKSWPTTSNQSTRTIFEFKVTIMSLCQIFFDLPRTGNTRRGINTASPLGVQEILVLSDSRIAIHDDGRALGSETIFMSITRDWSNTFNSEIKRSSRESSLFQEWHDETAKTTINMKTNVVLLCQFT